jgi:AcrR family transcriptional regulator
MDQMADAPAVTDSARAARPAAGTGNGRRARRRQELRDCLYTAAIELFTEQGFTETTMDAIAERADVARATVFNHFPQKVAFLEEWGRRRRAHVSSALAAGCASGNSAAWQLRSYLQEMAKLNVASRAQTVVLMDASARFGGLLRDPSLDRELASIIEAGQRTGEVRADVDASQAGALLATGYFSTVLRWIAAEPPPFALSDQFGRMLDIVLRGLLADPARRAGAARK